MNIWIDAQLPPTLASWIANTFNIQASALRDLGLRDSRDKETENRINGMGRIDFWFGYFSLRSRTIFKVEHHNL